MKKNISFWGNEENKFNLRDAEFLTKKKKASREDNSCDVRLSTLIPKGRPPYVYISINSKANKAICDAKFVKIGFVNNGQSERLYFVEDKEEGYKLSFQNTSTRGAIKVPLEADEVRHFMRYDGEYNFKYDAYNKAYYIEIQ